MEKAIIQLLQKWWSCVKERQINDNATIFSNILNLCCSFFYCLFRKSFGFLVFNSISTFMLVESLLGKVEFWIDCYSLWHHHQSVLIVWIPLMPSCNLSPSSIALDRSFKTAFSVHTELVNVGFCGFANTGVSMRGSLQENIAYLSSMSCSSYLDGLCDGR